jgi:hypothetical protein
MGAPLGNNNRHKNKPWQEALKKVLARRHGSVSKGLEAVANQLLDAADNGDQWALKEIGDRIDGKPAQQQIITGEDGGPLESSLTVRFVGNSDS